MAFSTETLTAIGAQFLASATAANKLIISGCNAYSSVYTVAQAQAVEAPPVGEMSNTTDASIIGATSNHVQIRATFHAGVSIGGDGHTLMVFGFLQNDPLNVKVIYVASDDETFHIPTPTDIASVFDILFDITYNADPDAITSATTSTYTSLAEFNNLKSRVVTTNAEGMPTTGENQTIYGNKTFNGTVTASTLVTNSLNPSNSSSTLGNATSSWSKTFTDQLNIPMDSGGYVDELEKTLFLIGNTTKNNASSLKLNTIYNYAVNPAASDDPWYFDYPSQIKHTLSTNVLDYDGTSIASDISFEILLDRDGITNFIISSDHHDSGDCSVSIVNMDFRAGNMYGTLRSLRPAIDPNPSGVNDSEIPVGSMALVRIHKNMALDHHYYAGEILSGVDLVANDLYYARCNVRNTSLHLLGFEYDVTNLQKVKTDSTMQFALLSELDDECIALVVRLK